MLSWVDEVLLSAVDSLLSTDSVINNSLLELESECKELTKFCGVVIKRNECPSAVILFTKTFSLASSLIICSIETLAMLEAPVLDR